MKKLGLILVTSILLAGCTKHDIVTPVPTTNAELKIANSIGIKLQTVFVTNEVAMNIKSDVAQPITIRIIDISNRVVSKETMNVIAGDNILKVYTTALPSSAYRIGFYDVKGNQLGITDFNKL
jgi:flavoprotein